MRKVILLACLALMLGAGPESVRSQDKQILLRKVKIEDLAPQYRRWLQEEVVYIISPKEKDVFLHLENDRERELFIEAFWKQRDPNPSTPQNEFKEEHYKRIAYANQRFGRGAPGPGWRTDRGRIYITLGEPQQKRVYDNLSEVVPVEIWFYQGFAEYGLPNGFYCVFFKKDEGSDYELYSPMADGPGKLLRLTEMYSSYDPSNYLTALKILQNAEPEIAQKSLSLIAGEEHMVQQPSMASEVLMANIALYPYKKIKDEYAQKFLQYKEIVEVDYTVNYIENNSLFAVTLDPSGKAFVQYSLEPRRLSVEAQAGRFFALLEVNGKVSDKQGRTIFQFERTFPLSLGREEVAALRSRPFSLQGMFPLAEGLYDLVMIFKNSVSKEFTTAEAEISVPAAPKTLAMSPLLLGYGVRTGVTTKDRKAFQFNDIQLMVSPQNHFSLQETVNILFQLLGPEEERKKATAAHYVVLDENGQPVKNWSVSMSETLASDVVLQSLDLKELKPTIYRLEVTVEDREGKAVLSDAASFSISAVPYIPRPLVHSDPAPQAGSPVHSFLLGGQYFNKGEMDKALGLLEDAFRREPSNQKYALGYAQALLTRNSYAEVKAVLEPFLTVEKPESEVYEFLGQAYQTLAEYSRAIDCYVQYLTRFGSKLAVYNSLGECYSRVGDADNALFAWQKSLEINPNQEDIRKKVAELKNKK